MFDLSSLLARAKAYLVAEATKVEGAISPAIHTLAHTILNAVEVDAAKIGAEALAAHQAGKSAEEVLDGATAAVSGAFKTQGLAILESAGVAAAKSIILANLPDVKTDDVQHINN